MELFESFACLQTLSALQPLAPSGDALRLYPGRPVSGSVRGACCPPCAHMGKNKYTFNRPVPWTIDQCHQCSLVSGHHARGAALSSRLHHPTRSLRQSDSSRQVLERPQKHLHHRHPHGGRGFMTSSMWWEGLNSTPGERSETSLDKLWRLIAPLATRLTNLLPA